MGARIDNTSEKSVLGAFSSPNRAEVGSRTLPPDCRVTLLAQFVQKIVSRKPIMGPMDSVGARNKHVLEHFANIKQQLSEFAFVWLLSSSCRIQLISKRHPQASQKLPKAFQITPKHPKILQSTPSVPKHTRVFQSTLKVPQSIPKYVKVPQKLSESTTKHPKPPQSAPKIFKGTNKQIHLVLLFLYFF